MEQLRICKELNFCQNWVSGQEEVGNAKELQSYIT